MRYLKSWKTLLHTKVNKKLEAKKSEVIKKTLWLDFENSGSDK